MISNRCARKSLVTNCNSIISKNYLRFLVDSNDNKYNLKGLDFIPLPKSPHYFLLRCNNIVRYDYDYNINLYLKDKCPTCNQWYEVCPQGILNIRMEDEAIMEVDTFYVSDIVIGEKVRRRRILYVTDNIPSYFKIETGGIFFNKIERIR